MIDWPLAGLAMALIVESCHWLRLRWDFDDETLTRSWRLSVLGIAVAAAMILIDGQRYTALPSLLCWLPALLVPVQFVQSFGTRDSIPLSEFSMLARQQRKRNERFGIRSETLYFNFGNVLFTATLIAATVGPNASTWMFLPGVITLIGWKLLPDSNRLALVPILVLVGGFALAGELGLRKLSDWIGAELAGAHFRQDPDFNSTMIGARGMVIQSPDIVWRVKPEPGSPVPPLLRTNTFNLFLGANWRNARVSTEDRRVPETRTDGDDLTYLLRPPSSDPVPQNPAYFNLRGSMGAEAPLPLPGDVTELHHFDFQSLEVDDYGRVYVLPKQPVISGTVVWRGRSNVEGPPIPIDDLRIPKTEQFTVARIADSLRLREGSTDEKISTLRQWFHNDFRYTRNLTIQRSPPRSDIPSALSQFLTTVKTGHCEYFAAAAVMLLREAGVPARYAVGYAVVERDPKRGEYLVRGTHGHAWCRYWDENTGLWKDFDATPPVWPQMGSGPPSLAQRLEDWLKRLREDFFLWRNQSFIQMTITVAMSLFGIIAIIVIFRRLWRSKQRIDPLSKANGKYVSTRAIRTPLHDLEKRATRILGTRSAGMSYAHWLNQLSARLETPQILSEALALHQRLRFDPQPPEVTDLETLTHLSKRLAQDLKALKRSQGWFS
jgi:transglutaminase-like putative cysteine protease